MVEALAFCIGDDGGLWISSLATECKRHLLYSSAASLLRIDQALDRMNENDELSLIILPLSCVLNQFKGRIIYKLSLAGRRYVSK
jgi:hypothetical protein